MPFRTGETSDRPIPLRPGCMRQNSRALIPLRAQLVRGADGFNDLTDLFREQWRAPVQSTASAARTLTLAMQPAPLDAMSRISKAWKVPDRTGGRRTLPCANYPSSLGTEV